MAAIIRNGDPVIHSAIVNVEGGLAAGKFVTLNEATNMVILNEGDTFDGHTYLTVHVAHDMNMIGDDATAVVAKGDYIQIVHPNPGDEVIVTGLTGDVGATVRGAFVIIDDADYMGQTARHLRRIEGEAETAGE